jgi:DNA-binding HxlR family transcriptional regulator
VPAEHSAGALSNGAPDALAGLVELLSRRYALGAIWELRGPAQPFRTLTRRLGAPDDRLSQRLRELRESGLLEVDEAGDYRLSSEGRRLIDQLEKLARFADGWAALTPRQRTPRGSRTSGRGENGWEE